MGTHTALGTSISALGSRIPYWTPQRIADTFLFYGETSKITGGKLYNQVKGSSDWLTVAGSAGSETYQAPNNATYQTADTDYIWFKTDATQRTVTTAELIGYDLQRSPVKYDDNSPNTIRKIGILKSGKVLTATELNELFKFFTLPVEWHNDTNAYGHIKDNRVGQNLWTPESVYTLYDTFTDTDGVYLHDHAMNVGAGWTATDNWTISSNKAVSADTASFFAIAEGGKADVDISLDISMPNAAYYYSGIAFRYQDATHQWYVIIERFNGVGAEYNLYEVNGGAAVRRATHAIAHEVAINTMRITASGNTIKGYWKGVEQFSYSSALFNDKTKCGLITYKNVQYVSVNMDNFILV